MCAWPAERSPAPAQLLLPTTFLHTTICILSHSSYSFFLHSSTLLLFYSSLHTLSFCTLHLQPTLLAHNQPFFSRTLHLYTTLLAHNQPFFLRTLHLHTTLLAHNQPLFLRTLQLQPTLLACNPSSYAPSFCMQPCLHTTNPSSYHPPFAHNPACTQPTLLPTHPPFATNPACTQPTLLLTHPPLAKQPCLHTTNPSSHAPFICVYSIGRVPGQQKGVQHQYGHRHQQPCVDLPRKHTLEASSYSRPCTQAIAGAQLFTVVGLDCLNVILTGNSWCTAFQCGGASWLFVYSVWICGGKRKCKKTGTLRRLLVRNFSRWWG